MFAVTKKRIVLKQKKTLKSFVKIVQTENLRQNVSKRQNAMQSNPLHKVIAIFLFFNTQETDTTTQRLHGKNYTLTFDGNDFLHKTSILFELSARFWTTWQNLISQQFHYKSQKIKKTFR